LKKEKKNWSNDLKLATTTKTIVDKVRGEPINHWHGRLGTYLLGYQIDTGRVTNWTLYSNRVSEAVWLKKFWN